MGNNTFPLHCIKERVETAKSQVANEGEQNIDECKAQTSLRPVTLKSSTLKNGHGRDSQEQSFAWMAVHQH